MRLAPVLVLLATLPANAAGISNDRFCQAIGDSPRVAVSPRDRAFFEDNCVCEDGECVHIRGTRYKQILAKRAERAKQELAQAKCEAELLLALRKILGRTIERNDPLGELDAAGEGIDDACARTRSATKALALLREEVEEQKRRDAVAAVDNGPRDPNQQPR